MFSDYSILFFLGILGNFLSVQTSFKTIKKISLSLFTLIFTITYIFLPSILFDNRYILSFYVLLSVVAAGGLLTLTSKFKYGYIFLIGVTSFLFLNYLTNTIAILPYGLGWAKTDNYLSRKMTENMEYYDFNHHFSKFMHTNETIATYGLAGYYYASFNPKNIYYFFNGNHNSLNLLLKQKIDKLLIRGGDFNWFCKSLGVTDCGAHAITLLAGYPQGRQYLYQINK